MTARSPKDRLTDAGIAVASLRASKADADRFFAERLRPAVEQVP